MADYRDKHRWLSKNWLVHRVHDAALETAVGHYARGIVLDIGCGSKPYASLLADLVTHHLGLDHPQTFHPTSQVDIFGTAYETGLATESVNTVLCTFVLEHLERPQDTLHEMYRILKPSGYVILSAPLFWHLHEEPRDFYRYTKHGFRHLFQTAGFEVVEIKPLAGFVVTFSQELVYILDSMGRGVLHYPVKFLQSLIQQIAFWLNPWDKSHNFTWAYLVVAQKIADGSK